MSEVLHCGEWGTPSAERWSEPWSASPEDLVRLEQLREDKIVELDTAADGRVRVAGRNYCGRARLPSGLTLNIASKVPLGSMIEWLAFTETVPELEAWTDAPTLGPHGAFVDALASFYIHELAHLTQFHWRHGYTVAKTTTTRFRGRLDVRRLSTEAYRLPALPCQFRERTMHTVPNRVLARALAATWRLVDLESLPESARRKLDWLTQHWADIPREVPSVSQAIGQVLSRPPVGYRSALRLARLLLQGVAIDPVGGDGGDIFLVNVSTVWEEGLRRMLEAWAKSRDLPVGDTDERTRRWDDATNLGEANRWLTADAMLVGGSPVVFDAKYKRGYGDESRGDRFQMAAYAMAFGAAGAVLVYPTAADDAAHRRLMKSALPGTDSEILSMELPMALGPSACSASAIAAFDGLCLPILQSSSERDLNGL